MLHNQAILDGLLAVMRHSTEPMAISDPHQPDMPLVAVNAAFTALTGYAETEIVGRNCRFLQGPKTDADTVRRMGECLRAGQGCIQWIENYRRDGSRFWNLLFMSPVMGPDGALLYFFANQHDLSAQTPVPLEEFPIGTAHMPPQIQSEFQLLLLEIVEDQREAGAAASAAERSRALQATLASARQAAALSMRLAAGPGVAA